MMPNSDPRDRFVCTRIPYTYDRFFFLSFSDALVTFIYDLSITTNVKHRVRTKGSEHQGQTGTSDPDQNLGFTCIFSSGMQEFMFCAKQIYDRCISSIVPV